MKGKNSIVRRLSEPLGCSLTKGVLVGKTHQFWKKGVPKVAIAQISKLTDRGEIIEKKKERRKRNRSADE